MMYESLVYLHDGDDGLCSSLNDERRGAMELSNRSAVPDIEA